MVGRQPARDRPRNAPGAVGSGATSVGLRLAHASPPPSPASVAILMREHGILRLCTWDADFHRFPFLKVIDPL